MSHHHHHHQAKEHGNQGRQAVETEFVTASPTFDGPIGGFVTPGASQGSSAGGGGPSFFDAGNSGVAPAPAFAPAPALAPAPAPAPASNFFGGQGAAPTEVVGQPVRGTLPAQAPTASHHAANGGSAIVGKPLQHTPTPSSSSGAVVSDSSSPTPSSGTDASQSSGGMSGGAKAGLAFGIIIIIGLIAGLAFFFYRKKKNQNDKHMKIENEKPGFHQNNASLTSHVSVRRAKTQAPRLSLRPMTEMFPDEKQQQRPQQDSITLGDNLTVPAAAAQKPRLPNTDSLEKSLSPNEKELSNPFGDHADTQKLSQDPFSGAGQNADAPKPLSVKPGNADREAPTSGPMAAGAAPPSGPGANNVHRVQLDFKPSMEDELELIAGQVVRMLHEYDDGWALCIRLDRSQQGVVPRSCLSKLPIKPRPGGPPPPHMRGPPPNGRPRGPSNSQGRPMSPAGGRMRSQSNTPYGGPQRPMSPYGNGPPGAGPDPRSRSNSNSAGSSRRITPPSGPMGQGATSPTQSSGIPTRKPVPGQAM